MDRLRIKGEMRVAFICFSAMTLVEPTVKKDLVVVDGKEMHRASDCLGRAKELKCHELS